MVGCHHARSVVFSPRSARPLQHLTVTFDKGPLSSAGSAAMIEPPKFAPVPREESVAPRCESRDRASHVGGAAAEKGSVPTVYGEKRALVPAESSHRHDVGMAAKQKCRQPVPMRAIEGGDVVGAGLEKIHAIAPKKTKATPGLLGWQGPASRGVTAFAANQRASQFDTSGRWEPRYRHDAALPPVPQREGAGPAGPTTRFL